MTQTNKHKAQSFISPRRLRRRDLLAPTVIMVMVFEALVMSVIEWLDVDLPPSC